MLKRALLLFIIIGIVANASAVDVAPSCTYRTTACQSGETAVLFVSGQGNAHAAMSPPPFSSYPDSICCTEVQDAGGVGVTACTASDTDDRFISLSSYLDNSQAAFIPDAEGHFSDGYPNAAPSSQACLRQTDGIPYDCRIYPADYPANGCVITISGYDNAHVAACDSDESYPLKVYCADDLPPPVFCNNNNVIDLITEQCDGTDFGTATCESEVGDGFTGQLSCSSQCIIDTSACTSIATSGDDILSVSVAAIGKIDIAEDWSLSNSRERTSFEARSAPPKDEVAYSATVRNLSDSPVSAQVRVELRDKLGQIVPTPTMIYDIEMPPTSQWSMRSFAPDIYTNGDLETGNYYFRAIATTPGEGYVANNLSTSHFSVGAESTPISVPDNNLLLVPLIALIVLGIILHEQGKHAAGRKDRGN